MRNFVIALAVTACVALGSASPAAFSQAQAQPGKGKTVRYAQGDSLGGNYVAVQLVQKAIKPAKRKPGTGKGIWMSPRFRRTAR